MIHILEPIDPDIHAPGGIKTVIHQMISGINKEFVLVGVTNNKNLKLGESYNRSINNRRFVFVPVSYVPRITNRKKFIPDSLSFSAGLIKYRSRINVNTIHSHRVEIGFVALVFFRSKVQLHQFVHTQANGLTGKKSESIWKYLKPFYFQIENKVLKKSTSVLVFNYAESKRLALIRENVAWIQSSYIEETFYPKIVQNVLFPKFIWVGRFEKTKNPILALEFLKAAYKIDPSVEAVFIGDGTLKKEINLWIRTNSMQNIIKVMSPLPPEDLAVQMRKACALLITSWFEGSPTAPLEANACGIPVISTREADPEKFIGNKNGVIISGIGESQVEEALSSIRNLHSQDCVEAAYPRRSSVMLRRIEDLSCNEGY